MRSEPKCPKCGWRLEFIPADDAPEYDLWTAKCYNVFCPGGARDYAPSDCGWTKWKQVDEFYRGWKADRDRRRNVGA